VARRIKSIENALTSLGIEPEPFRLVAWLLFITTAVRNSNPVTEMYISLEAVHSHTRNLSLLPQSNQ
jgi:predicted DNA-binding transcriptional regulator